MKENSQVIERFIQRNPFNGTILMELLFTSNTHTHTFQHKNLLSHRRRTTSCCKFVCERFSVDTFGEGGKNKSCGRT